MIQLAQEGPFVRITSKGLTPEQWAEFRVAIEGARYDRDSKTNLAALDKVPTILKRLRDACFHVSVDTRLQTTLQEHTAQQWLDLKSAKERIEKIDEALRARGLALYPFQRTGALWLATKYGALLADEMGLGKAQPVSEPVLTPHGWVPICTLRTGDMVMGSEGRPVRVTGVYPQGKRPIFRVVMTDGAWTRCCDEHLWEVQTPNDRFRGLCRTMSLKEIRESGLKNKDGNSKFFVPIPFAIEWERKELPVHPYVLGALIANGTLGASTCHSGNEEQRQRMMRYLPDAKFTHAEEVTYRITYGKAGIANPLTRALKELGLQHTRSFNKFIPPEYLVASVDQRTALLRGLMDNDGTISKDGKTIEYNTVSPGLSRDVVNLVRSLGGSAWVSTRIPKYEHRGEVLEGRIDYRVRMALDFCPFSVSWKSERYKPRTKYPASHAIAAIEPCGEEECVCIRVDAADSLYVTRDFILTHNTIQAITAIPAGVGVIVVAPAVAKGVWMREVAKWRPHLKVRVLEGRKSFRWPADGEMVVLNYDILPPVHEGACKGELPRRKCPGCKTAFNQWGMRARVEGHETGCDGFLVAEKCPGCAAFLKAAPENTCVIVDEAHALKSGKTKRTLAFRAISDAVRAKGGRVWLMTATPLLNTPKELWSVYQAAGIAQEAFGNWKAFVSMFRGKAMHFGGYEWGTPEAEVAERIRRVSLRRLRAEVLPELPTKTWREVTVDVDRKTLAECDKLLKQVGGVDKVAELLEATGIKFEMFSRVRSALATAKTKALLELIEDMEEQGEPLVVFSAHRFPIDTLGKRRGWATITGDTTSEQRTAIEERFQKGELRGVACTIRAGGVAITLTKSHQAIFVDREFTPALNAQAEDRVCRIGQSRGVVITTLVANHQLDARLVELVTKKQMLIDKSVNAAREDEESTEREYEAVIREAQDVVRGGRAKRRFAESPEEEAVQRRLHGDWSEVRRKLATRLAEQSERLGLSEPQWQLAKKLVKQEDRDG